MEIRVGFIGLGEMGKWMALNVKKAGFPLIVYDLRPDVVKELTEKGAVAAINPADVAEKTDCIMMSLPDTKVVENVIWGDNRLVHGLSSGSILVDLSTINYTTTVGIEKKLGLKGVRYIDAPVSGQEQRAKDGTLTVMAGGDYDTLQKIRPILNSIGNNVVYMGKSGNGQLAKLVNQLFYNISCAALAELLPMAVKMGLDPEDIFHVVSSGTGQTFALNFFTPYIMNNDFKPGYPLKSAYKDMISAAEISAQENIPLPVFFAAFHTYQLALLDGYGAQNKGAMIKVWEKRLGVEVRKRKS